MELYFLRHGIAGEQKRASSTEDAERTLTPEGIEQIKKVAKCMKEMKLSLKAVISSPFVRARQTAEIAAKTVGFSGEIILSEALIPDAGFDGFFELLKKQGSKGNLLFVGHIPSLANFVSTLISRGGASVDFKKGGLCRVDTLDADLSIPSELKWLVTPELLTRL